MIMHVERSHKLIGSTYTYARVEAAFARAFKVPPERVGALRGRIKHLMVLGLPEAKAGKGVRVNYGHDGIVRWLVALMFEDVGVPPGVAVKAIKCFWEGRRFDHWIAAALDAESVINPVYITMRPAIVMSAWDEQEPLLRVRFCRSRSLVVLHAEDESSWFCMRNLTATLTLVRDSLGDTPHD
jgi:hypothetical protein